ncbi:MAG: hypothetical protein K5896_00680 [Prevotella sp.]|nr:hypothetical protein [Prevotella sp.]
MHIKYFKTAFIGMACLWAFSAVLTSCSSDDNESESTEQPTDGRKLRQLTITDVPITRATLTDNATSLGATWSAGDKATYFNLSSFSTTKIDRGTLTANSSTTTSSFTGGVVCGQQDQIALIYPSVSIDETSASTRGTFTINLSGQAGTLADIAAKYHFVYGIGEVTSVTKTTATATISSMKSLLAVCKFTFNDGSNTIPVKTLSIGYGYNDASYGYSETGYPLTGTVNPFKKVNNVTKIVPIEDISVTADSPSAPLLTFNFGDETSDVVYAALFPVSNQLFHFTVNDGTDTYTGTATATLNAGKYYPVTLKLTKQQ